MSMEGGYNETILADNVALREDDPFVSDDTLVIFQYVCYSSVNPIIDVFGVLTNIVNIICFIRQGFKDTVNICLFGLAISDLGCLVTLTWLNVFMTPAFIQADLPFDPMDTLYITASYPHVAFTRISSFITSFITLERCVCITEPLKVKLIFTSKRVTAIVISSFIISIVNIMPAYFVNIYTQMFFPERNRTIMAIYRTENHKLVEQLLFIINIFIQSGIYICVIVCTILLTSKLQSKTKWRQAASSGSSKSVSSRDKRVAQMIVVISTLFIISFIPNIIISFGMTLNKELAIEGKYKNTLVLMFGCGAIIESLNSAVNIFIYYQMSTKYRATLRNIFGFQVYRMGGSD